MAKKVVWLLVCILALTYIGGCRTNKAEAPQEKIVVYASFYPLYYFTDKIGGEKAFIVNMIPPGIEPHDWEPGPQLLAGLHKADLLVYNGLGLEPWIAKVAQSLQAGRVTLVDCSAGIEPLHGYGYADEEDGHEAEEEELPDPHVWLDPVLALHQANTILEAFVKSDPANAEYYRNNFLLFTTELKLLDRAFRESLEEAPRREFVVTHLSFAYLAKRYNLTQVGISGLSPHTEPSPAELKETVDFARNKGIRYILKEPMARSRLAEVLAAEVGAEIVPINPLEGLSEQDRALGKDYLSVMYENLETLKQALSE